MIKKRKRHQNNSNVRDIKVCPASHPEAYDRHSPLPEIRLSGKWLETIGFVCGKPVTVLIEQNKITLSIEDIIPNKNVSGQNDLQG